MVLVTGASGFVGTALCRALSEKGRAHTAAVRTGAVGAQVSVGDIGPATDWRAALAGCSVVVHLAARVHVMSDRDADPLRAYREVNLEGTMNLARQAVRAGVKRFVFVSSVKVNGEATAAAPFSALDEPGPCDPYGQSKMEAERALLALARETGLEVVIVRPPLVYGPGVKANFLSLMRLVRRGLPLPLGSVRNRRSMVALDNLVDLLIVCCTHPRAAGGIFMVSDGNDVSVAELVGMIAKAMGRRPRLIPLPVALLDAGARMLGKGAVAERVLGSLQVDIASTQVTLEWTPVIGTQAAIDQTVSNFLMADAQNK
ncbi:UDP-glucose 4-epimerase family protein [Massilia glaciei]|uniref:UDP-glucose 4-epimerase n=1 Tax=Massilia glaciei TaxID=1524097 RepID=A0A2U2HN16_9BURK|nr:SDR family oxidoreductase [Massilia glaciei]PWF48897.1 UDP-glucose 4-epimerase [Massilia glaciei]